MMKKDEKHLVFVQSPSPTDDSPKVHRTKTRITDCFFKLLAKDPIERITVGEVCAGARINRSTFYNHFADIYDVRDRCEATIEQVAAEALPHFMKGVLLGERDVVAVYFEEHFAPYYGYLTVLLNGGDPAFVDRMRAVAHESLRRTLHIKRFSERQEYVFNAIAGMQLGIIGYWLATGRSMPLPDLIELISVLIRKGPRAALLPHPFRREGY